jgi:hypothetical protein
LWLWDHLGVSGEREMAEIYARQAMRSARAAIVVALAGAIGTICLAAYVHDGWGSYAVVGIGISVTAAMYAGISALSTTAQAATARHLARALAEESRDAEEPSLR